MVGDGLEPGGGFARVAVSRGFDGLASPAGGLADLYKFSLIFSPLQRDQGNQGRADHFIHRYGSIRKCDGPEYDAHCIITLRLSAM